MSYKRTPELFSTLLNFFELLETSRNSQFFLEFDLEVLNKLIQTYKFLEAVSIKFRMVVTSKSLELLNQILNKIMNS